MEEVQIVVERVGYGTRKWRWRLANECGLTVGLGAGPMAVFDRGLTVRFLRCFGEKRTSVETPKQLVTSVC